jgi:hypothetical protein
VLRLLLIETACSQYWDFIRAKLRHVLALCFVKKYLLLSFTERDEELYLVCSACEKAFLGS